MKPVRERFRAQVRAALAAPDDGSLASRFTAPLVTALIADAADAAAGPDLAEALAELVEALARVGVPSGRQFVLLGHDEAATSVSAPARAAVEPAALPALARALRAQLGLPVIVHDPAARGYVAGRLADGTAIELDDELREAEAIVTLGRWSSAPAPARGGPYLLCPGVACAATRTSFAAARARGGETAALAFALAAENAARVDLALWWGSHTRVRAASGRAAFAACAHEAGLA